MLAKFMARYPDVSLQLEATNRRVDVVGGGGCGDSRQAAPV